MLDSLDMQDSGLRALDWHKCKVCALRSLWERTEGPAASTRQSGRGCRESWEIEMRRVLWGCLPWGASAPGGRASRGRTWESTVTRTATLDQTYVSPTALSAWRIPPDWILTTPHDPHLSFPPFIEEDIERLREKFPQDPTAGKWWGWNFKQDLPDFRRLPWWFSGKESACNAGGAGSIPGLGRSPGGGNGNPLQGSCLSDPTDRGAWLATVHGVAKSRTRPS